MVVVVAAAAAAGEAGEAGEEAAAGPWEEEVVGVVEVEAGRALVVVEAVGAEGEEAALHNFHKFRYTHSCISRQAL